MFEAAFILGAAFLLDLLIGDPPYRGHPVRLIGLAATNLERISFRWNLNGIIGGTLFYIIMVTTTSFIYIALSWLCERCHPWLAFGFNTYVFYSSFALKDLGKHAKPIWKALENGALTEGRSAVQRIVGRDASQLDSSGVARACIESVAESFVDSFLAPLFWFALGTLVAPWFAFPGLNGILFALVYRVSNTLDSIVGYKNARYRRFGTASARADDLLNFVPARISVLFLFFAAAIHRLAPVAGICAFIEDRKKSPSPNAAHPESFVAGALGISLGGPAAYPFGLVDKPTIGNGSPDASALHVRQCWRLTVSAAVFGVATALLVLLTIP